MLVQALHSPLQPASTSTNKNALTRSAPFHCAEGHFSNEIGECLRFLRSSNKRSTNEYVHLGNVVWSSMELLAVVSQQNTSPKNQMNSSHVSGSKNASFVAVMMEVVRKSNGRKRRKVPNTAVYKSLVCRFRKFRLKITHPRSSSHI